jgi:hypothetical protein
MNENRTKIERESSKKTHLQFTCLSCDYTCSNKYDFTRHKTTRKHFNRTKTQNIEQTALHDIAPLICKYCDKKYYARNSLWYHEKKCVYKHENTILTIGNDQTTTSNVDKKEDMPDMKELIIALMTQNQDMQKMMFEQQQQAQQTQQQQLLEMMPHLGNTNNSNNTMSNSNNKTNNFNVNMFLNEHCQNAMNISDFIESLPITYQDLDNTRKHGLSQSISNMVIKGLDDMSIYERPIHCTDPSRKTVYVRDNDEWIKDENNEIMQKSSVRLAIKQRNNVKVWKDQYMVGKVSDTTQINYHDMVINCLKFIEHDEKIRNKIVKKICQATHLTVDVKQKLMALH